MNSKTWKLAQIMLKTAEPMWSSKKGSQWKQVLLIALIGMSMLPLVIAGVSFMSSLYDGLALVGQESVLLGLGFALASLAILVFSIFYVISVFYYSQDVEHYLPLPLKPSEILGAKFLVAMLYEYVTNLLLLAPLLITYGVKSGGGVLYYLYALLLYLLFPVLPLVLAIIIVMLFMRFTNVGKKKDRFRVISGVFVLILVIAFQFIIQGSLRDFTDTERLQQMILSGEVNFLEIVTQFLPASEWAALALVQNATLGGLGYLALFTLVSFAAIVLFLFLGNRLYFSGVIGFSESTAKRQKLDDSSLHKFSRPRRPWLAYAGKEWKILCRTPVYLLNCVLYSLFMPVILIVPFLGKGDEADGGMAVLRDLILGESNAGISLAIATAAFLIIAGMNGTSVTAITRDGQGYFVNKYLPVPYSQILIAKLLPGFLLSLLCLVLLIVEATLFIGLPWSFSALLLLAGIPAILFINILSLFVDLRMPRLNWGSEQEAVKQNLNTLFPLIFGIVTGALLALGGFALGGSLGVSAAIVTAVFAVADLILYRILVTRGAQWMENIE